MRPVLSIDGTPMPDDMDATYRVTLASATGVNDTMTDDAFELATVATVGAADGGCEAMPPLLIEKARSMQTLNE